MRLGVFGGTFNPIHYGHLRAAEEAGEILALDRVLFIPSGNPPLKERDLAPAPQRYEMARLAVAGNRFFDVLDIECTGTGKSYTVNTLEQLSTLYPHADLYFLLGIDAFLDIPNWWRPEKLFSLANFALLSRPGTRFSSLLMSPYLGIERESLARFDGGEAPSFSGRLNSMKEVVLVKVTDLAISSTDIRKRIHEGKSIKYLLPADVESFIISNRLFSNRE